MRPVSPLGRLCVLSAQTESTSPAGETISCPEAEIDYASLVDREAWAAEIEYIGKTISGEYNATETAFDRMQAASVAWCILWRVEDESGLFPNTIRGVVTQPGQFDGYAPENYVSQELREIAVDVLGRYLAWKHGATPEDVGCVLPEQFRWFHGASGQNWFRDNFDGAFTVWTWDWENPY